MQTGRRGASCQSAQRSEGNEERGPLTSIAVFSVCTLTAADSYSPYSFMSTTLPVSPSTPNDDSPAACFAWFEGKCQRFDSTSCVVPLRERTPCRRLALRAERRKSEAKERGGEREEEEEAESERTRRVVRVRIALPPQFCTSVRGITSMASLTARIGQP